MSMPTIYRRRIRPWERSFVRGAGRRIAQETGIPQGWTLFIPGVEPAKRA